MWFNKFLPFYIWTFEFKYMYILDFVFTEKDTLDVWVNGDKVETFVSTYIFDTLSLMLNATYNNFHVFQN